MVGRTPTFRQHIMLSAPLMLLAASLAAAIVVRECNRPTATDVVDESSLMSERADCPPVKLLERRLPKVRFDRVELKDALDFLQDVVQYPIDVDWASLAHAGVTPSTPITARLRDVKARKVLGTILDEAGGGNVRLAYAELGNGHVLVTTDDALYATQCVVRRYDVRDMVSYASNASSPGVPTRADLSDSVIRLIEDTVATESWHENGGHDAWLVYCDGWLVVNQIPENHRQLRRLLAQLREVDGSPSTPWRLLRWSR